jgi:hypothetical protein
VLSAGDKTAKTAAVNDVTAQTPLRAGELFGPSPSLIQILANPGQYHGKQICVEGFLRVEPEETVISLSKDDDRYMIAANAFWVRFDTNAIRISNGEIAKKCNGRCVRLVGTFDMNNHGHMGMFQGAFVDVVRVEIVLDRSERRALKRGAIEVGGK